LRFHGRRPGRRRRPAGPRWCLELIARPYRYMPSAIQMAGPLRHYRSSIVAGQTASRRRAAEPLANPPAHRGEGDGSAAGPECPLERDARPARIGRPPRPAPSATPSVVAELELHPMAVPLRRLRAPSASTTERQRRVRESPIPSPADAPTPATGRRPSVRCRVRTRIMTPIPRTRSRKRPERARTSWARFRRTQLCLNPRFPAVQVSVATVSAAPPSAMLAWRHFA